MSRRQKTVALSSEDCILYFTFHILPFAFWISYFTFYILHSSFYIIHTRTYMKREGRRRKMRATMMYFFVLSIRAWWRYQTGWNFGKIPNGLCPPCPHFRKIILNFFWKAFFKSYIKGQGSLGDTQKKGYFFCDGFPLGCNILSTSSLNPGLQHLHWRQTCMKLPALSKLPLSSHCDPWLKSISSLAQKYFLFGLNVFPVRLKNTLSLAQ